MLHHTKWAFFFGQSVIMTDRKKSILYSTNHHQKRLQEWSLIAGFCASWNQTISLHHSCSIWPWHRAGRQMALAAFDGSTSKQEQECWVWMASQLAVCSCCLSCKMPKAESHVCIVVIKRCTTITYTKQMFCFDYINALKYRKTDEKWASLTCYKKCVLWCVAINDTKQHKNPT